LQILKISLPLQYINNLKQKEIMKNFRIKSSDEIKASVCCATTGRFLAQLYDSGFSTIRGVQYSLLTKIPHTSAKELSIRIVNLTKDEYKEYVINVN
jgi:hypothetical protein